MKRGTTSGQSANPYFKIPLGICYSIFRDCIIIDRSSEMSPGRIILKDVSTPSFLPVSAEDRNSLSHDLKRPLRLFLVEDNPADAMLVEIGLENTRAAYTLEVAKDGAEAIEFLLQMGRDGGCSRPDLILLDLNLPRVTGQDVLRMIKGDPNLQAIPVIVLSSSSEQSDVVTAYRCGANSYLQKRASIEETFDLMGTLRHYWLDFAVLPAAAESRV